MQKDASLDKRTRTKLYGKKATYRQILDEVLRLRECGTVRRKIPMTWEEIGNVLGISMPTVFAYKKLAGATGRIELNKNGRQVFSEDIKGIQEVAYLEKDEFVNEPLVKEWVTDLRTRRNGHPIRLWRSMITNLRTLCNASGINPRQLIVDRKITETILKNFAEEYKGKSTKTSAIRTRVNAVRSFCAFHGMTWPKGVSGIMSAKVIGHGKYADIRLTQDEIEKADSFIKKRWGLDSDVYRVFWVGIESCARKNALLGMKCSWEEYHTRKDNELIFIMIAYESKTAHIKEGKWKKYITRNDTQKSLQIHKSRGAKTILHDSKRMHMHEESVKQQLREIYRHLGKDDKEGYFYRNPFHVLRHIGAHYWLSKLSYNYGLVAKIGGWHTIDELKASYGEMPPEFVIETIESRL